MKSKKKVLRKKTKTPPKKKLILLNFKVSNSDLKKIETLVKLHAGGNYSAWLRHASLNFRPKKGLVIR